MPARIVIRPAESRALADFLTAAGNRPSGLLVEGEAGIGKTTLLLATVDEARERGFRVLSARSAAAESVLAYAVLADLLREVEAVAWAELPDPQRRAVDRVLLRTDVEGPATDQREVAASFLTIVERLAGESPVLLVIDDLQWLDTSSQMVIAFAARRFAGRVGVLGAVRTGTGSGDGASWLHMSRPDAMSRITVPPLHLGGLHAVVSDRLGRSIRRSTMVWIWETSAGNPFYALELARAIDHEIPTAAVYLPATVTELVRSRIGSLDTNVQKLLLAASCVAAPTVELVAAATDTDAEHVFELLEQAERDGIVGIEGHRLRFEHPMLARGVYAGAATAQRRAMHRRLAAIVDQPELHARHLALAARHGDHETLESLDTAAGLASERGAPAAAAELLDLAVALGGNTAERRIRLAGNCFEAGDPARARGLLEEIIADAEPGPLRAVALSLLGSVRAFDDSFTEGVELWKRSAAEAAEHLALRVPTLVILALTQFSTGRLAEGVPTADQAVADATRLGNPLLLSQALGVRALIRFLRGEGVDDAEVQQALELEKRSPAAPTSPGLQMVLSPSLQHGLLLGWSGDFERAHSQLLAVRRLCYEHGHEFEWLYVAYYSAQIEIWWGNFTEVAAIVDEAMTRAEQIAGDIATGAALTIRAAVAAYTGSEEQARRDAAAAITMHQRCGARMLAEWPITLLGFVEVSLGNYEAALTALQPLLDRHADGQFGMEIHVAAFVPDAVEALVHLGRLAEAEPLVDALERNGNRLDRAWMLAVGARCRAMLLAARGDIDAACLAVEAAMDHHDRVPMPFERARTQVLLGQLQRRQRRKDAATATLRDAVRAFEGLGTTLWTDRARAELARSDVAHLGTDALTPSELRVAELAAGGMSNRDIAVALFISPKTVEANLARIYRKLDIHSRTQLARHLTPT